MRKLTVGFFMVLCCAGLLASGCAKKEIVQKDVTIPPAAVVKPPETIPVTPPPVKEEVVQQQTVKEAPAPVKTETLPEIDKAAALQKALERIYFDFDSFVLTAPSRDALDKNAALLAKNNPFKVQIEGHCDERGSDEYNLALGEKRAKAALSYLITLGISPERLSIISYGKEKPLDMGHDETSWAKNRRAEFMVVK
jgi:peptidoglycan-associated lipoprotein